MKLLHSVLFLLYGVVFTANPVAGAEEFVPVRGTGVAETEAKATQEAYYGILSRALTRVAGNQAEGEIGAQFRRDFDRNFDGFRSRYFTPETDHRCVLQQNGRHLCEVSGTLKIAALQTDLRKIVKTTEATLSNKLVFILSAAEAKDERAAFVVDKLTGEFQEDGHRILTGSKANKAISSGTVDFSLGIYEVTFTEFSYDKYDQRMSGALTVRFKLTHMKSGEGLATVPITVSTEVAGPSEAVLQPELTAALAAKASGEIARKVTENIITFQRESKSVAEAETRANSNQTLYVLRLNGLTQRDRKDIRAVRKMISAMFPDSKPSVDPSMSDDTRVTLTFATSTDIVPDDLLDELYAAYDQREQFAAEYVGGNEFIVRF